MSFSQSVNQSRTPRSEVEPEIADAQARRPKVAPTL